MCRLDGHFLQDGPQFGLKLTKTRKDVIIPPLNYPLQILKALSTFEQTTPSNNKKI